jgi:hypothetical protein
MAEMSTSGFWDTVVRSLSSEERLVVFLLEDGPWCGQILRGRAVCLATTGQNIDALGVNLAALVAVNYAVDAVDAD